MDINHLFLKAVEGKELAPHELDFVLNATSSEDVGLQIKAHSILLFVNDEVLNSSAVREIEKAVITSENSSDSKVQFALISALEYLPEESYKSNQNVRKFAYSIVKHGNAFCKINAVRVLRRIAPYDPQAMILLKEAEGDDDAYVREGATSALKLLERFK